MFINRQSIIELNVSHSIVFRVRSTPSILAGRAQDPPPAPSGIEPAMMADASNLNREWRNTTNRIMETCGTAGLLSVQQDGISDHVEQPIKNATTIVPDARVLVFI